MIVGINRNTARSHGIIYHNCIDLAANIETGFAHQIRQQHPADNHIVQQRSRNQQRLGYGATRRGFARFSYRSSKNRRSHAHHRKKPHAPYTSATVPSVPAFKPLSAVGSKSPEAPTEGRMDVGSVCITKLERLRRDEAAWNRCSCNKRSLVFTCLTCGAESSAARVCRELPSASGLRGAAASPKPGMTLVPELACSLMRKRLELRGYITMCSEG